MNLVALVGRLTRDPDIRYGSGENQSVVARFTVACDRRYKKEGGQNADFIGCVAFGRTAEFVDKYLKKGIKICLEGRIQTGSYTRQDGQKVYTTDVVAENIEFAESKESRSNQQGARPSQGYAQTSGQSPAQGGGFSDSDSDDGFMNIADGLEDSGLPFN